MDKECVKTINQEREERYQEIVEAVLEMERERIDRSEATGAQVAPDMLQYQYVVKLCREVKKKICNGKNKY